MRPGLAVPGMTGYIAWATRAVNSVSYMAAHEGGEHPGEPHDIVIYDYSSDVDGEDVSWRDGQRGRTFIYRHVLRFTPRG